jgi:hypothetical protein
MRHLRILLSCPKNFEIHCITGHRERVQTDHPLKIFEIHCIIGHRERVQTDHPLPVRGSVPLYPSALAFLCKWQQRRQDAAPMLKCVSGMWPNWQSVLEKSMHSFIFPFFQDRNAFFILFGTHEVSAASCLVSGFLFVLAGLEQVYMLQFSGFIFRLMQCHVVFCWYRGEKEIWPCSFVFWAVFFQRSNNIFSHSKLANNIFQQSEIAVLQNNHLTS